MESLENVLAEVEQHKKEMKKIKKEFGKNSVEYAEAKEDLYNLIDYADFVSLHY